MGKRVQDLKPDPGPEIKKWMKENVAEQKRRYRAIAKEMDDLSPKRDKWNREFLKCIQTEGFSVTGDVRRIIKKSELPVQPKRKHKVVF